MVKRIILLVLIFAGIVMRIQGLNEVPAGLFADEISMAVNSRSIAQTGLDEYGVPFPFAFESLSDYKLPGYVYSSVVAYKIFGTQVGTVRVASAVSGIVSIFLLGYLAKILFKKAADFPFFAMLAFSWSPLHIHFSRIAYETTLALVFILLFLISIIKIVEKGRTIIWLFVGGVSILIACWTYQAARFVIPSITILYFIYLLFFSPISHEKKKICFVGLFFILTFISSFIPTFFYPTLNNRPFSFVQSGSNLQTIFVSLLRNFNFEFLFDKGDFFAFRHGTKEAGGFLAIFFIPMIVGILNLIRNFHLKNASFILIGILILVCGLPSALTSPVPYAPRLLPMLIPYSLLLATGVLALDKFLAKRSFPMRLVLYSTMLIVLLFQMFQFSHIFFVHFRKTSLPEFPKAQVEMGLTVRELMIAHPGNQIYFLGSQNCRHWSHDDLQLWYFANLPNDEMIRFNKKFRERRYLSTASPFDAYELVTIPEHQINNLTIYPNEKSLQTAKSGDLFIRCAYSGMGVDLKAEKLVKTIYMYKEEKDDPFYIVTKKN